MAFRRPGPTKVHGASSEDDAPLGVDDAGSLDGGRAADDFDTSHNDPDFVLGYWHERSPADSSLSAVSEALDACDVGSRKASQLLSEYSVTKGGDSVSRSRIQRALEKTRQEKLSGVGNSATGCSAIFCDGRNDRSRTGRTGQISETVHNITVNMHPGDIFIGHFTCSGRHTGEAIAEQLKTFLTERGVHISAVSTIGGDGTNAVVGHRGGLMTHFERLLGRPLTRVVCLNHQAELPYRAVFRNLDGETTGPASFSGPIGKQLAGAVHQLPVAKFPPLSGAELPVLPSDVVSGLSKDLQLLVECAAGVASGDVAAVVHRQHGQLNMARWYTAQSRLLRVYMSQQCPSAELTTLATYVVCVYVPTVIAIRYRSDLVEAPKHFFDQLKRQRSHLTGEVLATAHRNMCRNSHMAHPEAVVLAMLGDERREVRCRAVQLVLEARRRRKPRTPRAYKCPDINTGATDYMNLVNVTEYASHNDVEPPLVHDFGEEQLNALLDEPLRTDVPCDTQSTERSVKLTTEAAAAVKGTRRQDGYSLNKVAYRLRRRHQ